MLTELIIEFALRRPGPLVVGLHVFRQLVVFMTKQNKNQNIARDNVSYFSLPGPNHS